MLQHVFSFYSFFQNPRRRRPWTISRRSLSWTFIRWPLKNCAQGWAPMLTPVSLKSRPRRTLNGMDPTHWPRLQPLQNGSSSARTSLVDSPCFSGWEPSCASWPIQFRQPPLKSPQMITCTWVLSWQVLSSSLASSRTTRRASHPRSWSPSRTWCPSMRYAWGMERRSTLRLKSWQLAMLWRSSLETGFQLTSGSLKLGASKWTTPHWLGSRSHSIEPQNSPMRTHWRPRIWHFSLPMLLREQPRELLSTLGTTLSWVGLLDLLLDWTLETLPLQRRLPTLSISSPEWQCSLELPSSSLPLS